MQKKLANLLALDIKIIAFSGRNECTMREPSPCALSNQPLSCTNKLESKGRESEENRMWIQCSEAQEVRNTHLYGCICLHSQRQHHPPYFARISQIPLAFSSLLFYSYDSTCRIIPHGHIPANLLLITSATLLLLNSFFKPPFISGFSLSLSL